MKEIKVFSSNDDLLIDRICAIFREKGIPFIKKEEGAGSYMNIAFGKSPMSKKTIFVSGEDYKKAKKLIDFLNAEDFNEEPEEISNELKAIPVDEFGNKIYSWPAKILGGIVVAFFIALVLLWVVQVVRYFN